MKFADATILIADYEPELLEIFTLWLERAGCKVLTAVNGEQALQLLQENHVDALISDIRMPVMDGVTLVRRLHALNLQIPSIIFVSGFGDIDPREVYALGVQAMLPKPLSRQQLLKSVEDCLKGRTELWNEPLAIPPAQSVNLLFESLKTAIESSAFGLGRGGCCFRTDRALSEDQPIRLAVQFEQDGRCLEAEGIVRWFRAKESRAGVEFTYLDPASRGWTTDSLTQLDKRSFIPH